MPDLILSAGYHQITVRFYEAQYLDGIELFWLTPAMATQPNDTYLSEIPYYGTTFHGTPPTYNPNTNWRIIPQDVLYASNPVPLPGAFWILGTGIFGIVGLRKRMQK